MKKVLLGITTIAGYVFFVIGILADLFGVTQGLKEYDVGKYISPVIVFFSKCWPVFLGLSVISTLVWLTIRFYKKREQQEKDTYLSEWFIAEKRNTKYYDGKNYLLRVKAFLLDKNRPFSWWMISSVAGMGKTRTIVEAIRDPRISTADIQWLKDFRDYKEEALTEHVETMLKSKNRKHIIIAEDAQINMRGIGFLISLIDRKISENDSGHSFRLLLLVRTDETDDSRGRYAQLFSLGDSFVIENTRYKESEGSYELKIDKYPEDKICSIVESYISTTLKGRHQAVWTEAEMDTAKKQVLHVLSSENMDSKHLRPLFAIFIADTLMNKVDPTNWSKEKILDYITEARFSELVKKELHGIQRNINDNLFEKTESIFCLSIIRHGVPFGELGKITKEIKKDLRAAETGLSNAEQLFTTLQMLDSDKIIKLQIPDILSEYFVYKKLILETNVETHQNKNRIIWVAGKLHGYIDEATQFRQKVSQDFGYLFEKDKNDIRNFYRIFLENCSDQQLTDILKYFQSDNFMSSHSDSIIIEEITDFYITRTDVDAIHRYVDFLVERFESSNLEGKRFFTEQLGHLCEKHDSVDILTIYCRMLVNLAVYEKEIGRKRECIEKLEEISHGKHKDDPEIVLTYCHGLVNLSLDEKAIGRKREWITTLRQISDNHQDDPRVVLSYCHGLATLARSEKEIGKKNKCIEKLEEVCHGKYKDDPEIVLEYCMGLLHLTACEEVEIAEKRNCIDKLEALCSGEHQDNPQIVFAYCQGLFNLVLDEKDIKKKRNCINKLEAIYSGGHQDNSKIVLIYCQGLVNLARAEKEIGKKCECIDKLEEISCGKHKDVSEIVFQYCIGLLHLTACEEVEIEEKRNCIRKMEAICRGKHKDVSEIVLRYCMGLFNMKQIDEEKYGHYMSEISRLFSDMSFRKYALSQEPDFDKEFMMELHAFEAASGYN